MDLIIDRPDRRTLRQRYGDYSIKVLFILVWYYLWLPAITGGAWYLAHSFYEQHLILLEGYKEYKSTSSLWYLGCIVAMIVLILAWSKGNKILADRHPPLQIPDDLSVEQSSASFHLDSEFVSHSRSLKNMTVSFDAADRISGVRENLEYSRRDAAS